MKDFRQWKTISRTTVWYKQGKIFLYCFWTMIFLVVPDKMASSVVLGSRRERTRRLKIMMFQQFMAIFIWQNQGSTSKIIYITKNSKLFSFKARRQKNWQQHYCCISTITQCLLTILQWFMWTLQLMFTLKSWGLNFFIPDAKNRHHHLWALIFMQIASSHP